ncbi:MAG: ADP-ribosylglycohydrolase family protein [Verrucomicrobia bacterium]|nr:ADP-ribosylglycohydrolase family protein [Verrucomicrobiota bacterium]MCH8513140.1 ADP-ribosylglycohydrolase family protein [Kiritimatiellia bacterium]
MKTSDSGFEDKIFAAYVGGAIGDGIGAPIEGLKREAILGLIGPVEDFPPPTEIIDGLPRIVERSDGKGDGRITDDTLMVEALIDCYLTQRDHLDARAYQEIFAPQLATRPLWIPEWRKETPLLPRLANSERLHIQGLLRTGRDPRFFGATLHQISCGAAMFAWPIGAVNAGDPRGAYDEAVAFFAAQTHSYGVEQAAVMAAATAEALRPGATPRSVVDAALALAKDGTLGMIRAAVGALTPGEDRNADLTAVHRAVQPWHHKGHHVADDQEHAGEHASEPLRFSNIGMESRLHTSEELPVALAMLLRAEGDFRETVCASAEYGEDADSIAGMAGTLAGALGGLQCIPADWVETVARQNRRDPGKTAREFTSCIRTLFELDAQRQRSRHFTLAT